MGIPEAATFANALDCLGAGLFLVEETGRIVHANASAHGMLHKRSVLRAADSGKLVACEASSARALREVITEVAGAAVGARAIVVPLRASDGEHCIAHVLPLAFGSHRCEPSYATLLVHKVALELPFQHEAIAGTLRTDAERAARAACDRRSRRCG